MWCKEVAEADTAPFLLGNGVAALTLIERVEEDVH